MVTPFTFTSYYISKVSENYAAICNSDISYFMVGHFYKGVAMSAVQWLESGIFFMVRCVSINNFWHIIFFVK